MIDLNVTVCCDYSTDDDFCEARFEVLRTEIPEDIHDQVVQQMRLRGWSGDSKGRVECPLHRVVTVPEGES